MKVPFRVTVRPEGTEGEVQVQMCSAKRGANMHVRRSALYCAFLGAACLSLG